MRKAFVVMSALMLVVLSAASAAAEVEMDGLTGGDASWEQAYDEAMLDGRAAYNSGDREEARKAFVRASQIFPQSPATYRNLARNYNLGGEYTKATAYYDVYLRLAPDADDADVIREERRGTIARGGDDPWREPAGQRMALRALERELDDGRALTAGDGGAWAMYKTLLGTGYASPDLEGLRHRLERKMAAEFEERFEPDDGFLPVVSEEEWALQRQRLEALSELVRDSDHYDSVTRRMEVIDAVQFLFDGDYDRAADEIELVMISGDSFDFVGWYRVIALEQADRIEEALEALDELVENEIFEGEGLRRAEVVRAQLLQRLGDSDEAAAVYRDALL